MERSPGPLIASGRAADVYEFGEGQVLRRYKVEFNCEPEAEVMSYLYDHGVPVPRVFDARGRDLVMERLDGPTMIDAISRRPWTLRAMAHEMARIQRQLNAVAPPAGLACRFGDPIGVLHFDLHPVNIIMTSVGAKLIDFSSVMAGDPAADVAQSWVIMATSEIPGSAFERAIGALGRRALVSTYLRDAGRDRAREFLADVAQFRLGDVHVTNAERARIRALAERHG